MKTKFLLVALALIVAIAVMSAGVVKADSCEPVYTGQDESGFYCFDYSVCGTSVVACMSLERAREFYPWMFPTDTAESAYPGLFETPFTDPGAYPGLFATVQPGTEINSAFWTPEAMFDGAPRGQIADFATETPVPTRMIVTRGNKGRR